MSWKAGAVGRLASTGEQIKQAVAKKLAVAEKIYQQQLRGAFKPLGRRPKAAHPLGPRFVRRKRRFGTVGSGGNPRNEPEESAGTDVKMKPGER